MRVKIGERIKELRRYRELTQEELADIFSVSPQAISRWENDITYPDINLLPSIAYFFRITVDELLGMDQLRNEEEIGKLHCVIHKKIKEGDFDSAVDALRDALKQYPKDHGFMCELALALTAYRGNQVSQEYLKEAVEISEEILDECTCDKIRSTTKANLCILYKRIGRDDEAKKLARTLPHVWESREVIMPEVFDSEEREQVMKKGIGIMRNIINSKVDKAEDRDGMIKNLMLGVNS